ncbi:tyrosine-type recombinase/integrase [Acidaminobacter hydrogenoformans]|uniref:Site-specific recombinase XerD n=1 Tax=Acidaminobacter hydrogenoformans DSM 2784 TaxID=1120920 RepID=A0A1G5RRT5_9FIRM|nr:tyrosine-type recombinase/integrase [Acidaminobacter hydrogenoformans]SCZ76803.1 Site-specific recombinase XerD [Acidaminobacter hydrogenoformans DSM 2784]
MSRKTIKIHNKSSKPDNIVLQENDRIELCEAIEHKLPHYLSPYFTYLKNAVSLNTRLAYLRDLEFFLRYIVNETRMTAAEEPSQIELETLNKLHARDINYYMGEYCARYVVSGKENDYLMENHSKSLGRKRSSLSVFFKYLYREGLIERNITDGFNPIKLPKPQPDAIKKLEIDEVAVMLDAVETGKGLTEKELQYWQKTKYRDKAILMLFTTYGLRLSELEQLNLSSFHFGRGEFKIYRKRGKEVNMPVNRSIESVLKDYIELERKQLQPQDGQEDALFLSLQGTRMTVKAIRQLVKKYTSIPLGTAREDGYSPHKLRATAASSLIEYGFSIYDVQSLLDHDNVTTTQLYAAHRKNLKREIVNKYELLDEFDKGIRSNYKALPEGSENTESVSENEVQESTEED